MDDPKFPTYPGYAKGANATGDRCVECHRPIAHGAWAVWLQGAWWHARCLSRRLDRYAEALADLQDGLQAALIAAKGARRRG